MNKWYIGDTITYQGSKTISNFIRYENVGGLRYIIEFSFGINKRVTQYMIIEDRYELQE